MSHFWKDRSVLVTGCTGFLGGWLTARLIEQGAHVVGLVRDRVPQAQFFAEEWVKQVTVVSGDLCNEQLIQRTLNEHEIDTVFHLAAQAIVGVANMNPVSTFESNIRGTWLLLEACRNTPRVSRVVMASSDKAYGDHEHLPYDESFPLQGKHPYDVSKSCADLIAHTYFHTYQTPVCVTRCGNLFGPGDLNYNRIIPGTMRSILNRQRPVIRSDGSPMRDYVFVGDIADAYLLLAEKMENPEIHGRAYNFGSGQPISVLDLTQTILSITDQRALTPYVQNSASGEITHQYLSCQRAENELGWQPPATRLKDRLAETFDWYASIHHQ